MRSRRLFLSLAVLLAAPSFITGCKPTTPPSAAPVPQATALGMISCPNGQTCTPVPRPTSTLTPTITPLPPNAPPTATPTLSPRDEQADTAGWPASQADAGHTGAVDQALSLVIEPKWIAQPLPALAAPNLNQSIVADDEIAVVASAPFWFQVLTDGRFDFDSKITGEFPTAADNAGFALYAFRLADGTQKWRHETRGSVFGSPQIAYGRVYAVIHKSPTTEDQAVVSNIICLSATDGSHVWTRSIDGDHVGQLTVQDGVVVVPGRRQKQVLALDAGGGKPLWNQALLEPWSQDVAAPALDAGRVFLADQNHLYALELQTGRPLWRLDAGYENAPFDGFSGTITAADGRVFFSARHPLPNSSSYEVIYAVGAASGDILWHRREELDWDRSHWGMSTHRGGLFFPEQWSEGNARAAGLIALSVEDGHEIWRRELDGAIRPPALGSDGRLLVSGADRWILRKSGSILWSGSDVWFLYFRPEPIVVQEPDQLSNCPLEECSSERWISDAGGRHVPPHALHLWDGAAALSNGLVIGWTHVTEGMSEVLQLVAYGPDTTPPDAWIAHVLPGTRNIRSLGAVYGAAYDYNIEGWTLELRCENPPSDWEVLYRGTGGALDDPIPGYDWLGPERSRELGEGTWTLRLVVTDKAGLTGTDTQTFTNDWTAPRVEITSPKDGTFIRTDFTLEGSASDTNGVAQVRVLCTSGTFRYDALANGTLGWSLLVPVRAGMEVAMTCCAEATDPYGNVDRSQPITLSLPRFDLTLHGAGRRLVSSMPIFVDGATDIDGDGIDQRWENAAIELIKPMVELDEEEGWLGQYPEYPKGTLYPMLYFVRVTGYTPAAYTHTPRAHPPYILFYIVFAWSKDWGLSGTGVTDVLEAHRGDTENVIMAWRVMSDNRTVELEWVRTSAHKDVNWHHGLWSAWQRTCNLFNIALTFDTPYGTEMKCANLEFLQSGRLLLYPSENKHALYPTTKVCESVSTVWDLYGEDCGWEPLFGDKTPEAGFLKDGRYKLGGRWLFEAYNAGEPQRCSAGTLTNYQLIDFLDQPYSWRGVTEAQRAALSGKFPREAVWSGNVDSRAKWEASDSCTLVAGNTGGASFCGNLKDTAAQPEKCSAKVGTYLGQADDWTDAGPAQLIRSAVGARYQVTIKTGPDSGAGTDERIELALVHDGVIGTRYSVYTGGPNLLLHESSVNAPYAYVGEFENGSTDTLYLDDTEGGEITHIWLANPEQLFDDWEIERVVVRDMTSGKVWATWPQGRWIEKAQVELWPYEPGTFPSTEYLVIVDTGDAEEAGTNGDVSITLTGADGSTSGPHNLNSKDVDDFERASLSYFTIKAPDLGELTNLRVSLTEKDDNPRWFCREVTVRNLITGQTWVFPIGWWMGGGMPLTVDSGPIE